MDGGVVRNLSTWHGHAEALARSDRALPAAAGADRASRTDDLDANRADSPGRRIPAGRRADQGRARVLRTGVVLRYAGAARSLLQLRTSEHRFERACRHDPR